MSIIIIYIFCLLYAQNLPPWPLFKNFIFLNPKYSFISKRATIKKGSNFQWYFSPPNTLSIDKDSWSKLIIMFGYCSRVDTIQKSWNLIFRARATIWDHWLMGAYSMQHPLQKVPRFLQHIWHFKRWYYVSKYWKMLDNWLSPMLYNHHLNSPRIF